MKRWTSISENPEEKRWQALSEQLAAKGCVNEFVPWTGNAATITDLSVFEEFDHVRFSTRLGMQALKLMKIHSSWLTLLGVADGMTKVHGEWWPQCALYESNCQVIVE